MSEQVDAAAIVAKKRALAAKAAVKRRQKKARPPAAIDRPWHVVTGGPLNLEGVRDKAYNKKFMHILFTFSCGLMLLTIAWMVIADWVREWKPIQQNFREASINRLRADLAATNETLDTEALADLDGKIQRAKDLLGENAARLDSLEVAIEAARGRVFMANNMVFQIEKAVLDTDRRSTDEKVYVHPQAASALQGGYARDAYRVANYFEDYELRKGELDALILQRDQMLADLTRLERERSEMLSERDRMEDKLAHETHWFNLFVDAPMMDFLAPNLVVEGVITPNLFNDYNFNNVRKVENCMTCHQAIDKAGFEQGLDFNGDGDYDDPEDIVAHPYKTHPHQNLMLGGTHPVKQFGCTVCHQGNGHRLDFVHAAHIPNGRADAVEHDEAAGNGDGYGSGHGDPRLAALDATYAVLQADENAAAEAEGREPREVEKSELYNELLSKQQVEHAWDEEYNYHAVWMADMDHYWDWPQLPNKYLSASCSKCHQQEQVIPGADLLNRGRELVEKKGCYACHKIDLPGLRVDVDVRKTGPDLRHVGQKVERGVDFLERWIWYPKTFRPNSHMPRFFGNLNSDAGDAILRSEAMVRALSHLILKPRDPQTETGQTVERELVKPDFALGYGPEQVSELRAWLEVEARGDDYEGPAEAWPAAQQLVLEGRNAFKGLGCLGCHQNEADGLGSSVHGPSLAKVGSKLSPAWLFDWLKNPKKHWSDTVMPDLRLSDDEATVLANYLMLFREDSYFRQDILSGQVYGQTVESGRGELVDMLVKVEGQSRADAEAAVAAMSDEQVMQGVEDQVLAYMVLQRAGDLRDYLIAMERGLQPPDAPAEGEEVSIQERREMRDQRIAAEVAALSDDEVARRVRKQMLRYMTYQKMSDNMAHFEAREQAASMDDDALLDFVGNDAMNRYGCFGCHNINGYLDAQPIGTELTYEGSKELDKLDFGFWPHTLEHNKQDWFLTKILNPRIYDVIPHHGAAALAKEDVERNPYLGMVGRLPGDERPRNMMTKFEKDRLRMPQYDLTRDEAEALTCFLLGRVKEPIPEEMLYDLDEHERAIEDGRRIVREYNCAGCHYIGNEVETYLLPPDEGAIADVLEVIAGVASSDETGTLDNMRAQLERLIETMGQPQEVAFDAAVWDFAVLGETEIFERGVRDFAKITASEYAQTLRSVMAYVAAAKAAGKWSSELPETPDPAGVAAVNAMFKSNRELAKSFQTDVNFGQNLSILLAKVGGDKDWRSSDDKYATAAAGANTAEIGAFFTRWAEAESRQYEGEEDNPAKQALRAQVEALLAAQAFLRNGQETGYLRPLNHYWLEGDVFKTTDGKILQGFVLEANADGMKFVGSDYGLASYLWDDIAGEALPNGMKEPLASHAGILTSKYVVEGASKKLIELLSDAGVRSLQVRGLGEGAYRDMVDHMNGRPIFPATEKANAPPILPDEGEKVRSQWLFEFLKEPYKLRPLVNVRMPTFGFSDLEAERLAAYFAAMAGVPYPFEYSADQPLTAEETEWAEQFITVQCQNCHVGSDRSAPTLGLTAERLRTDWVRTWITVPEHRQPGTKMVQIFFAFSERVGRLFPYLNGEEGEYEAGLRDPEELGTKPDDEDEDEVSLEQLLQAEPEQAAWRQHEIDLLRRYLLKPDFEFIDPSGDRHNR